MDEITLAADRRINVSALDRAMRAQFGERISGISVTDQHAIVYVLDPQEGDVQIAQSVLDAHDPDVLTPAQEALEQARLAPERARAIPGWATWDEAQAVAYIENNVKDLPSAKIALVAMARLLVALRDAQWPGLGIEG